MSHQKLPTIKQIECFLAVAHELNFRRAAEKMHMTQPPLTRQIQSLETVIGRSLFIRDTHQVHLTEAGIKLQTYAESLLQQVRHFIEQLHVHVEDDEVQVGMTRTLDFNQIAPFNTLIAKLDAVGKIASHHLTSKQLLKILASGNLDLALIGEKPLDEAGFTFYWLHQEPLMLALPSSHPASLKDKVHLLDVVDLPLYWLSRHANPGYYDKCEKQFQKLAFSLKRKPEPDDSLLTLSNIARGAGMALIPYSMCTTTREGVCYRALVPTLSQLLNIDVYLAIRAGEQRKAVMETITLLTTLNRANAMTK
ncbi:MAG: LysR family transcriptional regulator [Enterobacteriaceae bacterium]